MSKNLLFAAFLFMPVGLFAQELINLSLEDAIQYAIKNQPSFQNYKVEQQISSAKRLQSTSEYLPTLNGTAQLQDNLRLPVVALQFPNPLTQQEENLKIKQGTNYQGNSGVNLNLPLLNVPAISDIQYSKKQQALTDLQLQQAIIDLKVNVTRAYYLVLLNQERITKTTKTLERDQKVFDDTKVKFDNQNALKSDVSRAYLNLQNTKYQLKVSEDSVKTSSANLAQLIGLPINSHANLTDVLPMHVEPETLPEYPDFKSAEQNRLELKTEAMQEYLNKLQLKKISYGYIPTLSGIGNIGALGLDDNNLFQKQSWFWNSYIGISLNVPLFDGLLKVSQAQQQKLAIVKNENNIKNIRNTINYQLQTSSVNYSSTFENLALIQDNVKLAEEVVKEVNSRYQNANATYQEVVDAENTLKDTEFNYLQALYAFLLAELDWKKANGKL